MKKPSKLPMVLLDKSPEGFAAAAPELEAHGFQVGQLLTPLTQHASAGRTFAIDNGAFAGFREEPFLAILKREKPNRERCLWVAAPDIVGSARRTMEVFPTWHERIRCAGFRVALVLQDGIEDQPIPWGELAGVFVGGSTRFKVSNAALDVARAAKILGLRIHVGRVNTPDRLQRWIGVADSIDGTGLSRYSHMRRALGQGLDLFDGVDA